MIHKLSGHTLSWIISYHSLNKKFLLSPNSKPNSRFSDFRISAFWGLRISVSEFVYV